ncbi:hypothetical protein DVH05_018753 [Phytophthora capsici]|nr:hypothetical protein DVH05_018753 [Phytophthora capsici]
MGSNGIPIHAPVGTGLPKLLIRVGWAATVYRYTRRWQPAFLDCFSQPNAHCTAVGESGDGAGGVRKDARQDAAEKDEDVQNNTLSTDKDTREINPMEQAARRRREEMGVGV